MTDRIRYLTVVLDQPIREDDLEPLLTAIGMLRGVRQVVQGQPDSIQQHIATSDAFWRIRQALYESLKQYEPPVKYPHEDPGDDP